MLNVHPNCQLLTRLCFYQHNRRGDDRKRDDRNRKRDYNRIPPRRDSYRDRYNRRRGRSRSYSRSRSRSWSKDRIRDRERERERDRDRDRERERDRSRSRSNSRTRSRSRSRGKYCMHWSSLDQLMPPQLCVGPHILKFINLSSWHSNSVLVLLLCQ